MKTTFELPDNLFKRAKMQAAIHSLSLKELFRQSISEKFPSAKKQSKKAMDEVLWKRSQFQRKTEKNEQGNNIRIRNNKLQVLEMTSGSQLLEGISILQSLAEIPILIISRVLPDQSGKNRDK